MIYAGFWRRFGAHLIDFVVLAVGGFVLGFVGGIVGTAIGMGRQDLEVVVVLVATGAGFLYFVLMESSSFQATCGKAAFGIRVTDLKGRRVTCWHAALRNLAKLLSALTLGFGHLMAGFTRRKQALHDMCVGCLVIHRTSSLHVDDGGTDDLDAYTIVAQELASNRRHEGLWLKSVSDSHGDETKGKSLYVRARATQISRETALLEDAISEPSRSASARLPAYTFVLLLTAVACGVLFIFIFRKGSDSGRAESTIQTVSSEASLNPYEGPEAEALVRHLLKRLPLLQSEHQVYTIVQGPHLKSTSMDLARRMSDLGLIFVSADSLVLREADNTIVDSQSNLPPVVLQIAEVRNEGKGRFQAVAGWSWMKTFDRHRYTVTQTVDGFVVRETGRIDGNYHAP